MGEAAADERGLAAGVEDEEEETSPIEEVRLTVPAGDDPTLPVWTFRMWSIGLLACALMSFLNQFFSYRTEPLIVTQITVQVASLPLGHFMARALPRRAFRAPAALGGGEWSLNPGPFNMKEHVLISIFANAGCAFGNGNAYAVMIVDIIRAFYQRSISFIAAWLLIMTTQVLGYGWAGLMRKYVVEPAHMWWPSTLVQVSLFSLASRAHGQQIARPSRCRRGKAVNLTKEWGQRWNPKPSFFVFLEDFHTCSLQFRTSASAKN